MEVSAQFTIHRLPAERGGVTFGVQTVADKCAVGNDRADRYNGGNCRLSVFQSECGHSFPGDTRNANLRNEVVKWIVDKSRGFRSDGKSYANAVVRCLSLNTLHYKHRHAGQGTYPESHFHTLIQSVKNRNDRYLVLETTLRYHQPEFRSG